MKWLAKNSMCVLFVLLGVAFSARAAEQPAGPGQNPVPEKRAGGKYDPFPNPGAGYVTDLAHLLTPDEEERIERWLWQTESKTGVEIIVVTINSIQDYPGTPNASIEQFATALFDRYGIGNMPENKGVLLLVAAKDRKARIELGAGYGRARDRAAEKIMQGTIVPRFRKDEYARGITEGVKAIMREFASVRVTLNWPLIAILIAIPIVGLITYSLFKSGKTGWGWVCVGLLIVLLMLAVWIIYQTLRAMPKGRSSGWSSGGLGGFGGGFSGGGGATGSW